MQKRDREDGEHSEKIPVTVLTGFLGAGKTTLLNHILTQDHGLKVAVIENEFGEVGIDDALVRQKFDTDEEIFEMNNGCICCTVRGDLIRILNKILKRKKRLDAVLIETTGMADPAPVVQTFFMDEGIQAHARLDAVITVVDAKHVVQHLDEKKADGAENECVEQVVFADRILLNKTDLVESDYLIEVEGRLRDINKVCDIIRCCKANVPLDKLLGIGAFDLKRIEAFAPDFLLEDAHDEHGSHDHGHTHTHHHHTHDSAISSVGILQEGSLDLDRLNSWMSKLLKDRGADIYRSKGVLSIKGMREKFVFQGVHMTFNGEPQSEWGPDEKRVNRMVFIGKNLDRKELVDNFDACIVPEDA